MSSERLNRAQRALFEAMGQIAILDRMIDGLTERVPNTVDDQRPITLAPYAMMHTKEAQRAVREDLRKIMDTLERLDVRLEEMRNAP